MFKTLLLISFIAVLSSVYSLTLCEKYGNITQSKDQTALITGVVGKAVGHILQDNTGLRRFFDGSYTVKTNYTGDQQAYAILAGKLVSFFYTALGCSDGTTQKYTGNLTLAHQTMNISYGEFNRFNYLIIQTLQESGFVPDDLNAVASAINDRTLCTSTDMTCGTICNKYSIPWASNNSALVGTVVNKTVMAALGSNLLRPFFDGTTPTGSTNFTDPTKAAQFKNLFDHLVQFFGGALGCSDSSIPPYAGNPNLKAVHVNMPINKAAFEAFNSAIVSVMQSLGVAQPDLDAVASVLASTKGDICNQADCGNAVSSNMGSSAGASSNMGSSAGASSNMGSSNMGTSNGGSNGGMTSNKASSTQSVSSSTGNAFTLIFSVVALFVTLLI